MRVREQLEITRCEVLVLDYGIDVVSTKQQVILAVNLYLIATKLAIEDLVSSLNIHSNAFALIIELASANGDYLAALRLLLGTAFEVAYGEN